MLLQKEGRLKVRSQTEQRIHLDEKLLGGCFLGERQDGKMAFKKCGYSISRLSVFRAGKEVQPSTITRLVVGTWSNCMNHSMSRWVQVWCAIARLGSLLLWQETGDQGRNCRRKSVARKAKLISSWLEYVGI
jgi:hypothetical protein